MGFVFLSAFITNMWMLTIALSMNDTRDKPGSSSQQNDASRKLNDKIHKQKICLAQFLRLLFATHIVLLLPLIFNSLAGTVVGLENIPLPPSTLTYLIYMCHVAIFQVLETCLVGRTRRTLFKCCFCL